MLPEDRSDDRNKNDTSPLQSNFNDFEEVDEDLVEIYRSYNRKKEEDEVVEVGVLVIKPGNKQRLLTCDVPLHCDERDLLTQRACSDGDALDDEVVEVPRKKPSIASDNDEIEEIRADDEVFIEKVIMKHNLSDQVIKEAAESTNETACSWETMEVDEWQNEEGERGMNEDVIPIERVSMPVEEGNETEELPAPVERVAIDSNGGKEDEEVETSIEMFSPNVSFTENYFTNIKERVNEIFNDLGESKMEEGEKETAEEKMLDPGVEEIESEKKMEEDRLSFESLTDSEKEMEEDKAVSEKAKKSESEKEMEEDEVPPEDNFETVCIADDILDDDENENDLQTPTDKTILFIYPMSRGGITVTRDDYECLSEYQYLNDIIIDFYLKYQMQEVLSKVDRERTHLFSSHFYTRLTKHTGDEDSVSLSLDERRYAGVQRWTKDVNIFEKDFVIIPINEHSHWFLAIICFPKLVDFVGYGDCDCNHDGVELQKPCILIFDSLSASKKARVAVTLRGYLRHEYEAKMNEKKEFNSINLKLVNPKAPCQQNATDCGLYILQYVESFFKDPLLDFTLPLKDLSDWFPTTVIERKRERIARLIAKLAVKFNNNKTVNLPPLTLPKPKLALQSKPGSSTTVETKKSETKAKVQPKKKVQAKRTDANKRLKNLCDSDSDSDGAPRPLSSRGRSRLRVSSNNPQPLRRSAYVSCSKVPNYFSFDESDDSSSSATKTTSSAVPSSFLKSDVSSNGASGQATLRTYRGPLSKSSWRDFSELTGSKTEKGKLGFSSNCSNVDDRTEWRRKEKQDASSTRETTKSILKSGGIPTDRFYNLSMDALYKSPSLPTDMSFSQYKIRKKNLNSEM